MAGATKIYGDSVEPIRNLGDIDRIRGLLADRPRDRLLFEAAIQTGLPLKWLLELKVVDLVNLGRDRELVVRDQGGREMGVLVLNGVLGRVWQDYLADLAPEEDDFVFKSSRSEAPLSLSTVTNMVNEWFDAMGLVGPRGIRSLRRTYEHHFIEPVLSPRIDPEPADSIKGLKPVQMVSANEVVYQNLLDAIVSGEIPPGERLIPEKIAKQMEVSRMPVREALQRLRATGFISVQGRGVMIVNKLSREDLEEIQHIRLILEQDAAGRAALNHDQAVIDQLEMIHRVYCRLLKEDQRDLSLKYNKDFHMTIYRQAGMPILAQMIESLLDRIGPYLYIWEMPVGGPNDDHIQITIANHRHMLDGMCEQNPEKVIHWLTSDHNLTTERILSHIDAG